MRGESMKGKSKKSTYSTTFGIDPVNRRLPHSRKSKFNKQKKLTLFALTFFWCSERDSNPHDFRHTPLKRTCLPIPPPERFLKPHTCTDLYFHCKTFFYFFEFFFFSPGLFFMNRLSFASDNPCVYC